ncbi:Pre-mRNA-splicing factor cef1 [Ceratobasidium sp. 428]|nr:Pre-mRNA-splicing factor cef1 [Ceratobasidium sp. 428]
MVHASSEAVPQPYMHSDDLFQYYIATPDPVRTPSISHQVRLPPAGALLSLQRHESGPEVILDAELAAKQTCYAIRGSISGDALHYGTVGMVLSPAELARKSVCDKLPLIPWISPSRKATFTDTHGAPKAATDEYGKHQWARISSLLVRKTPKQCKARWHKWLDPSIKKTEWSKTEDEKLLHLAKLMPTQWRTIAPIAKENEELGLGGPEGSEAGPSADDIRRLRPGEIDPDPETKPARPDPIDMDEDEKEMLSEARARLANTQGKKAKRKARERQLEEARQLAVLQKKRELKAAACDTRRRKREWIYSFRKETRGWFLRYNEEQAKSYSAPVGQSLRRLENKRKPQEEEAKAKKRQKKGKKGANEPHSTKFIAARDAQIQKLKEAEQISKRRSLVLPEAQVGEAELEEIVKIGQAGQSVRALMNDEGEGNEASGRPLGEYEGLGHARMARTPRTAPQEDNIMAEARNLRNMVQA